MNKKKLRNFEISKRKDQTQYISNQVANYYFSEIDHETGKRIEKVISGEEELEEGVEITVEQKAIETFNLIRKYVVKEIRKEIEKCNYY